MNTPLNAPITPNDLVLRLIGSNRDGQLVNVANEKFLLSGLLPNKEDAEKYRCAIFRGEKGVAFRSYSDLVLCNGAKVAVQWLKKGDLIKLNDQLSIEIYQLGVHQPKAPAIPARQSSQTIELSPNRQAAQTMELSPDSKPRTYSPAPTIELAPMASVPAIGSTEGNRFKPATDNFRVPAVITPLESHRASASTSASASSANTNSRPEAPEPNAANEPATPMLRVPVNTYAIEVVPTATSPDSPSVLDSLVPPTTLEPTNESPQSVPASLDSLTNRLEKLVDSAGASGEVEHGTPSQAQSVVDQLASVVSPTETLQPETLQPIIPTVAIPSVTPAAETSPTTPDPQPVVNDDSTNRRSALEDYFSQSGISLSGSQPQSDPSVTTETNVVSEPSLTPSVAAVAAIPVVAAVVTPEPSSGPQFDLESVLANLGTKPEETPTPVAEPAVALTPIPTVEPTPFPTVVVPPLSETADHVQTNTSDRSASLESVPEVNYGQQPLAAEAQPADRFVADPDNSAADDAGPTTQSFELLQSLGLDAAGLSEIKKEISAPLNAAESETTDNLVANQTADSSSPDAQPEQPSPVAEVESVADVLARMKMAGSLSELDVSEPETAPKPTPTPAPVSAPLSAPVAKTSGAGGEEADGSVEDYMSKLLGRMRGDAEPTTAEEVSEQNLVEERGSAEPAVVVETYSEPAKPSNETLTAEEFVPQQKAVRMQSLDSLREIANSNSREAIRDSIAKERKVGTQTKLAIALISLLFAVLFFIMSYLVAERVNVWGIVFGIAFLCFGILTSRAYISERQLDESILSD